MDTKIDKKKGKNYSADLVARFFLLQGIKDNKPITNKKLQKLLYYAQAWNLVFNKEPLFNEQIEAWVHGPTVRVIYNKYKEFGFNPINVKPSENNIENLDKKTLSLLSEIWRVYGKYDADYLELLTHNEQPWLEARAELPPHIGSNRKISLDTMKSYYANKLDKKS